MKIACIGSRETTSEIEKQMEQIGRFIVEQGWWLGSGNAIGSDYTYARGANEIDPTKVILYLPWKTYNEHQIIEGNRLVLDTQKDWETLAAHHHPRFPLLTRGAKAMMIRNVGIVRNADAVVAFLNRTKIGGGGTGHGWRIAETLNIPKIDISLPKNLKRVFEFLLAQNRV